MRLKGLLFLLICSVFFIEIIQVRFKPFTVKKLKGAFEKVEEPELTTKDFLSGDFQHRFNLFHEDALQLHPFFVRVRNQFSYWLYDKAYASNVVIGKENVLYQDFYIDSYLGKDYVGEEEVRTDVNRFVQVQKKFRDSGKQLVLLIAPGKVSMFPEFLPDRFADEIKNTSNYEIYTKELGAKGAVYFDAQKYLRSIRDTSTHPLFPRTGTHWSGYAVTIVADTLFKFLEHHIGKDFGTIKNNPGIVADTGLRFTDSDIGDAMNLLFPIKPYSMYYPSVTFNVKNEETKPDALLIGDSFTQSFIFFYPYFDSLFSKDSRFWYYNKVVAYPENCPEYYKNVTDLNLSEEINKRDLFLIVSTEQNLKDFGFGFLESVERLDLLKKDQGIEQKFSEMVKEINSSTAWLNDIAKKARTNKIELQKQVERDALWLLENRKEISAEQASHLKKLYGIE